MCWQWDQSRRKRNRNSDMTRPSAKRIPLLGLLGLALAASVATAGAAPPSAPGELRVEPASVTLGHHRRPHSLVVTTTTPDGLTVDLTTQARYESADPNVTAVDPAGRLLPVGNGTARVTVSAGDKSATVDVEVKLPPAAAPVSFRHDVMPV